MKNYFSLLLPIIIIVGTALNISGQSILRGFIKDKTSDKSIPYVNIGLLGEDIGTVSNYDGTFELTIPANKENSLLVISSIGYENLETKISQLSLDNSPLTFNLVPKTYNIEEVVVTKKALKSKILGVKTTKTNVQSGFASNKLGCEAAMKMKVKRREQVLLDKFKFMVAKNECDSLFFRLNIYDVKNGKPGNNITPQNIFITTDVTQGIIEVDLSPYEIWMEDDFFMGLEWIRDFCDGADTSGFNFSAKLFNKLYFKTTSQSSWTKLPLAGIALWTEVKYCKKDKKKK